MRCAVVGLALFVAANAFAGSSPEDEIAARSKLPASYIRGLLQHCDSDQISMNFCAWRDQIVAERELQRAVDQHIREHPEQQAAIESEVEKWKKARDLSCDKSSREEWGGGSMLPAARATCVAAVTKAKAEKLARGNIRKPS